MAKIAVGVLRGGPSSEYEVSLRSGGAVLSELDRTRFEPKDIFISRSGEWHLGGVPVPPERALRSIDVAFNTIHGEFGEDGTLHRILEASSVPYTGADAIASVLSFNKQLTKDVVRRAGVKVAYGVVVDTTAMDERALLSLFRSFPMPAVVKPVIGGSSVGVSLASDFFSLEEAIHKASLVSPKILIEEFIKGREATVGIIDHFRGEKAYPLFPIEIIPPPTCSVWDYEAKYNGKTQEICPGNFGEKEKRELAEIARVAHEALELRDYSRSDFIVSPRGIYFLEVNSAAAVGLTKESLLPKAIRAVGSKLSDFLTHVVELARRR